MSDHPSPAEMSAFVRGELPLKRSSQVLRHLLQGCEVCLAAAPAAFDLHLPAAASAPQGEDPYDAVIDRAIAKALRYEKSWRRKDERSRQIVARLEAGGPAALEGLSRNDRGLPLVEALLERSWAVRHDDPAQMVDLARLATLAARDLDARELGAEQVADIQCRAWAELANALRVSEDLDGAEETFDKAYGLYQVGSGDKLLLAHILDLLSSLYRARRKFEQARTTLSLVYTLYLQHGQKHLAGRALLSMGIFTFYAGEPENAIRLLQQGLELVDERRDPDLVFSAVHNQLAFMADCGRFEEARKLLFLNRWRYEQGGGRINQLKLQWLEGRIDAGLGKLARAEETFREVRTGFEQAELGYQAALSSLDLATVLLRLHRGREARDTVLNAAEVFRALRIQREVLAAVQLLRDTFELGLGTVGFLEDVLAFLRRAEHDLDARFAPLRSP